VTINPLCTRPRVVIPPRKAPTKAEKVAAWNAVNGLCELCGKPVALEGLDVEYDHRDMREITGDDTVDNLRPTHVQCHRDKTSEHDAPLIAKVRRQEALTRPKVKKAGGFHGWRRFNGDIVRAERRR
jgi:5-methylcytosine-specific restriction endonuclease McrA